MGIEAEMKKKIRELEAGDDAEEASSPPKKKPRVEKAPKGRKLLGKENRKKHHLRQRRKGRKAALSLLQLHKQGTIPQLLPRSPQLSLPSFRR